MSPIPERRAEFSHTTVFLRNRPQLEELAGALLPSLWPDGAKELQTLVCGGSIGCEAFSILVALREFGPKGEKSLQAEVMSIDIAEAVTEQGRAGRFSAETFAPLFGLEGGMPEEIRARWFTPEEDGAYWRPKAEMKAAVVFETLDLLTDSLTREFDLLICQNVLTHLETPTAIRLLDQLLMRAKKRAVVVCSGVDLDLKTRLITAGFIPWAGRLEAIHEAFASHRMHFRVNPGQHYFELEDIDRTQPDWEPRYCTLFYRR